MLRHGSELTTNAASLEFDRFDFGYAPCCGRQLGANPGRGRSPSLLPVDVLLVVGWLAEAWRMTRGSYYILAVMTRVLTDVPLLLMFCFIHFGMRGHGDAGDALSNAVLFAAFAGIHSLLAREGPKKILSRVVGEAFIRIAYVILSGVTLALLLLFWRPVTGELWHARGPVSWFLTGVYFASILGLFYVASCFDYLEFLGLRQIERSIAGRPKSPPALSVKGPYGYCRHPMYFALLAVFWIGPVMTFGHLEFAFLGTLYLLIGVRFEEGNLRRELGADYGLYCAHVPMLIPRLTAWQGPPAVP